MEEKKPRHHGKSGEAVPPNDCTPSEKARLKEKRGAPEVASAPRQLGPVYRVHTGDGVPYMKSATRNYKSSGRVQEIASRASNNISESRDEPEVESALQPPSPVNFMHYGDGGLHMNPTNKYKDSREVQKFGSRPCAKNKSAISELPETISTPKESSQDSRRFPSRIILPPQKDRSTKNNSPEIIEPSEPFQFDPTFSGCFRDYRVSGESPGNHRFGSEFHEPIPTDRATLQPQNRILNNEMVGDNSGFYTLTPVPQNEAAVTLQGFTVNSQRWQHEGVVGRYPAHHNVSINREEIFRNAPLVEGTAVRKAADSGDKVMKKKGLSCITAKHRAPVGICLFIVLIAVIVAVTVPLVSRQHDLQTKAESLPWTTQPPPKEETTAESLPWTTQPTPIEETTTESLPWTTQPPPNQGTYDAMKKIFETVSSKDALEDTSSPQHQALLWVSAEADATSRLDEERHEIVQRYALATIYFATGGPTSWISSHNFLSSRHVCNWNEDVPRYEPHNWTSKGVFCTSKSFVVDVMKLSLNNLTGSLPDEIGLLSGLRNVTMYLNKIHGAIPSTFGYLKELRYLSLSGNYLTGSIPGELSQAQKLTSLFLIKNKLSVIPRALGSLKHLSHLGQQENSLSGSLPFTETSFPGIQYISLKQNRLSGSANALFSFKELSVLDCSFNNLTGTLPSEDRKASKLRSLDLANNSFFGSIPQSIGKWGNGLEYLQLAGNSFTSSLPTTLARLSNLTTLSLSRNELVGKLPAEISSLVGLEVLTLNDNGFTGFVPRSFSKLTSLDIFLLENNMLSGSINFMCSNISFTLFGADCRGEPGRLGDFFAEVTCSCCTHCCRNDGSGDHVCLDKSHGEDIGSDIRNVGLEDKGAEGADAEEAMKEIFEGNSSL